MSSEASLRRVTNQHQHGARTAQDLMQALDPALGVIDSLGQLGRAETGLPVVVRAALPARAGEVRHVHGRGASADEALSSAVAAAFERQALDELAGRGAHLPGAVLDSGARVLVDARRVVEHGGLGCYVDLAGAVEHATLEACERRALRQALAAGQFVARLDERGASPMAARILEAQRGRGGQVISVVVDRGPPVVACIAIPAASDQAIVIGIAAARTCAAAWSAAALELHAAFAIHARRDRAGAPSLGVPIVAADGTSAEVVGAGRPIATDRAMLIATLGETRRTVAASTIAPWSRALDAIAVELSSPAAARFGRRVVAVVVAESAERGALALV